MIFVQVVSIHFHHSHSLQFHAVLNLNPKTTPCSLSSIGVTIETTLSEEQTAAHAALISQLADKAASLVETLDMDDQLNFLRIRSHKREIMVSPDKDYLLIVIQNPHATE